MKIAFSCTFCHSEHFVPFMPFSFPLCSSVTQNIRLYFQFWALKHSYHCALLCTRSFNGPVMFVFNFQKQRAMLEGDLRYKFFLQPLWSLIDRGDTIGHLLLNRIPGHLTSGDWCSDQNYHLFFYIYLNTLGLWGVLRLPSFTPYAINTCIRKLIDQSLKLFMSLNIPWGPICRMLKKLSDICFTFCKTV